MNTVKDIVGFLKKEGQRLKGLEKNEIEFIEEMFKVQLPYEYRDFLFYMGRGADHFMRGSSVFNDELWFLREYAVELCKENKISPIPKNAFPFWMHQGYMAAYFIPEEGPDPHVYYFEEGKDMSRFEKLNMSFVDFLKMQLLLSFDHYTSEDLFVTPPNFEPAMLLSEEKKLNKKTLNDFGARFITDVRDQSLYMLNSLLQGKLKNATGVQMHEKIKELSLENQELLKSVSYWMTDQCLHNMLYFFASNEEWRISSNSTKVDIAEVSDGLMGELYSDDGWIRRFSEYPDQLE